MIKRIENLTKKERNAYERRFTNLGKVDVKAAAVAYIKENNTIDEIAYWLKHEATTTVFPGTPANWICPVFLFNRLHEYCKENGAL